MAVHASLYTAQLIYKFLLNRSPVRSQCLFSLSGLLSASSACRDFGCAIARAGLAAGPTRGLRASWGRAWGPRILLVSIPILPLPTANTCGVVLRTLPLILMRILPTPGALARSTTLQRGIALG